MKANLTNVEWNVIDRALQSLVDSAQATRHSLIEQAKAEIAAEQKAAAAEQKAAKKK